MNQMAAVQAATNELRAQLTAAVASSTAAAQDITAAVLLSQEDTAAATENDTQPAADEHEAAQGTDSAGDELQCDAVAAARDDSKAAQNATVKIDKDAAAAAAADGNDTQPAVQDNMLQRGQESGSSMS